MRSKIFEEIKQLNADIRHLQVRRDSIIEVECERRGISMEKFNEEYAEKERTETKTA
jgi:hypothetical protein